MGLLTKIFGTGVADAAMTVAERGADIVERWKPSDKAKHDMAREDLGDEAKNVADARTYEPKSEVQGTSLLAIAVQTINVVVDAANRMVRPTLAFTLMGTLFGWWDVTLNTKDPLMTQLALGVFAFYFGVRGLTEDLPKIIKALKGIRA